MRYHSAEYTCLSRLLMISLSAFMSVVWKYLESPKIINISLHTRGSRNMSVLGGPCSFYNIYCRCFFLLFLTDKTMAVVSGYRLVRFLFYTAGVCF